MPTKGLGGVAGKGMKKVKEAYALIRRMDVLDVSADDTETQVAAENARVSRAENQVIVRLLRCLCDQRSECYSRTPNAIHRLRGGRY